jgi:hypothetical protein
MCAFATSVAEVKTATPLVDRETEVNNEVFAAPIKGLTFDALVETVVP